MTELPLLDETRCNGCADCVAVCPTDCLTMRGAVPYLIRPADCISCGLCVLVCPSTALQLSEPAAA
jgi:NAD-dependent dihydropyrimidine dehydrogenase PreA subunit